MTFQFETASDLFDPMAVTSSLVVGPHCLIGYRGLVLNDLSQLERFFIEEFTGFEDADLRISDEDNTQEDGSFTGPGFYGPRTMTMSGFIECGTYPKLLEMQRTLQDVLMDLVEYPLIIAVPDKTLLRENLVLNPNIEVNASEWFEYGSPSSPILGQSPNWSASGDYSLHFYGAHATGGPIGFRSRAGGDSHPVTPGNSVYARCEIHSTDRPNDGSGFVIQLVFYEADQVTPIINVTAPGNNLVPGEDAVLEISGIAPANAAFALLRVYGNSTGPLDEVEFYTDEFMVLDGSTGDEYFDGSYPNCAWMGAEGLSSSRQYEGNFEQPDVQIYCRKADKLLLAKKIEQNDRDGYIRRAFTIALKATDPVYRSTSEYHASFEPTFVTLLGRAYDRSYDLAYDQYMDEDGNPVDPGGGANSVTIVNLGNWYSLPRIRFNGFLAAGARLLNQSNGHEIRLTNPVYDGDYIEIDTAAGTIVDALGTNRADYFDTSSDWMRLVGTRDFPGGENKLILSVTDFNSNASVEVWWQDCWL